MYYSNVVFNPTSMIALEQRIEKILEEHKQLKTNICYEDLGKRLGLIPRHRSIAYALGNLVWEDIRRNRPIRSSMVVRKGQDIPAPRFFEYMRELGFVIPAGTEAQFAKDRQQEVWNY